MERPAPRGDGKGRSHGTSSDVPFDRWFRYPAGFASDYVAALLGELDLKPGALLADPFAGSAVSGTAARSRGLAYHGVEAHPLVAELGRLKLHRPGEPWMADEALPVRASLAPAEAAGPAEGGTTTLPEAAQATADLAKVLLAEARDGVLDDEADLVRRSFDDDVLADLVALRAAIRTGRAGSWGPYLKWALLATLRDVASVKVGWPYQRPGLARAARHKDAVARFRRRAIFMADDLDGLPDGDAATAVVVGDSRDPASWAAVGDGAAAGLLTSPPYLNNFDYADATRLELYFWTTVDTWAAMCAQVRAPMLTATTQQSSRGAAAAALAGLDGWPAVRDECVALTAELTTQRSARARGKEYDQVLPAYLAGVGAVMRQAARILAPGAPAVLLVGDSAPYGVYLDTPRLIAELGRGVGLVPVSDRTLRIRGNRWTSSGQRHGRELSERMVVLRRA